MVIADLRLGDMGGVWHFVWMIPIEQALLYVEKLWYCWAVVDGYDD